MNASLYRFGLLSLVCVSSLSAADIRLTLTRTGDLLQISFPTEVGKHYALESATDLQGWGTALLSKSGDGQTAFHDLDTSAAPVRFFRLVVEDSSEGLAPSEQEAAGLLVGGSWGDYEFVSTNRFDWNGEDGDWSYQKTGPNTGLLVFTYDEDGNDPDVYYELMRLSFFTATSGVYSYAEYYNGERYLPSVIGNEPFTLPSP